MARDNGQGIFTMDFIQKVEKMPFNEAVQAAIDRINLSTATEANKMKATQMVTKCGSVNRLLLGMSNFSLSHQGLKTL